MVKLPLSVQRVVWLDMQSAATWEALGPVEDMPTARSSPESEYRSTDRGSEAKRNEDVKENRCPLGMEGVTDQLVNTAGASEQYPELQCLRKLLFTDREEAKQAKPASRENCTQSQTPARAKSQASGEEQETELEEAKNTERPGSSITGGTRQSVPASHPRSIWSRFLPDVCRKVTRDTRPKEGHKRSPAALPGFPNSAWITTHPQLLVDEALGVQEKPRAARAQSGQ